MRTQQSKTDRAATHKGTCQCCGAVQKLPEGVLAKHGYTTRWGFFSGVCSGSGFGPYEKGTDLIARFIGLAEERLDGMEQFRKELLARPVEGTKEAWVRVYRDGKGFKGMSRYEWVKVELRFTVETSSDGSYQWVIVTYEHPDRPGKMQRLDFYGAVRGLNPLDYVQAANAKRAEALKGEIEKVREYIGWQRRTGFASTVKGKG